MPELRGADQHTVMARNRRVRVMYRWYPWVLALRQVKKEVWSEA